MLGNAWVVWVILGIEIASLRLVASFTGDELTLAANAEYMLATAGITSNGCRGSIEYNIAISGT